MEDRKRRLANSKGDLNNAEKRIRQINRELEEVEKKVQVAVRNEKALKLELDKWRQKVSSFFLIVEGTNRLT